LESCVETFETLAGSIRAVFWSFYLISYLRELSSRERISTYDAARCTDVPRFTFDQIRVRARRLRVI